MSKPAGESKSLDALERQAEATRADLVNTVDELRQRASPDALKAGVTQYVRDARHGMFADLRQRANENPLQAVAVGAGLAYPVWRILCNLPAPIFLIGAGVALAGRGGASGSKPSGVKYESSELPGVDKTAAAHAPDGLGQPGANASSGVRPSGVSGVSAAADRPASAITPASSLHASTAQASSSNAGAAIGGRTSWDDLVREVERHPLVAGGVGLLIGALFATSLPRSRVENRLFGEASDELKNRASDAVSSA